MEPMCLPGFFLFSKQSKRAEMNEASKGIYLICSFFVVGAICLILANIQRRRMFIL